MILISYYLLSTWTKFYTIWHHTCKELTLECLNSFVLIDILSSATYGEMCFRLGSKDFSLTEAQFNEIFGFSNEG